MPGVNTRASMDQGGSTSTLHWQWGLCNAAAQSHGGSAEQVRIQPDEAIYIKIVNKNPGLGLETGVSELDLTYHDRYPSAYIPDAYERLILDAIRGDQQHFVRRHAGPCLDILGQPALRILMDTSIHKQGVAVLRAFNKQPPLFCVVA